MNKLEKNMKKVVTYFLLLIILSISHSISASENYTETSTVSGLVEEVKEVDVVERIEIEDSDITSRIGRRSWTCHATVFLTATGHSYTFPQWRMSGGIFTNRHKKCKQHIQRNFLNSSIWNNFPLTPAQENSFCQISSGVFRIEYGFNRRSKSWQFSQTVSTPSCDCEKICPSGWWLDGGGRCASGVCGPVDLPNQSYLQGMTGIYIWEGYIYQAQPPVLGDCFFVNNLNPLAIDEQPTDPFASSCK